MEITQSLIYGVIALIMFGIGCTLRYADFGSVFKRSLGLNVGLILQLVFLPALAFLVVFLSDLDPAFKVGLFIVALCPGGATSNYISYIVKADVALSIALTCINSLIILFTIPLLSQLAVSTFMEGSDTQSINIVHTALHVFMVVIIPAGLGVLCNERFPDFSNKIRHPLRYITTGLLALVFGLVFLADRSSGGSGISANDFFQLLPYCLLLHFLSMLLSYFISKNIGLDNLKATTIGIEVGLQNTALALLVTGTLIGNIEMTKPALVYAIFSFVTTLAFALIAIRQR